MYMYKAGDLMCVVLLALEHVPAWAGCLQAKSCCSIRLDLSMHVAFRTHYDCMIT